MARKLSWGILIALLAVGTGVAFSLKPWQHYRIQQQKADRANLDMKTAEQERTDLIRRKARYESPIGKEELARERGFTSRGERPIEVPE